MGGVVAGDLGCGGVVRVGELQTRSMRNGLLRTETPGVAGARCVRGSAAAGHRAARAPAVAGAAEPASPAVHGTGVVHGEGRGNAERVSVRGRRPGTGSG